MHNLSIAQAVDVWGDLVAAYYGKNGFGGSVAEIYLYRLAPHISHLPDSNRMNDENHRVGFQQASWSLVALIKHFEARYSRSQIEILLTGDETAPAAEWIENLLNSSEDYLDWRVHLKVTA